MRRAVNSDMRFRLLLLTALSLACGPGGSGGPGDPGGPGGRVTSNPIGAWRAVPITSPDGYDFADVDGSSANDLWVVGRGVFHWNGSAFSEDAQWTNKGVRLVAVAGPNDVYLVPSASRELHHFDGASWTKVATLVDPDPITDLFLAGAQVWITTYDKLFRLEGNSFSNVPFPSSVGVATALGPDDILATVDNQVQRWSGGQWSPLFTVSNNGSISEIKAFAANDIWVRSNATAVVAHWDGTTLQEYKAYDMGLLPITGIDTIWGVASNDMWFARPYFEGSTYVDPAPSVQFIHWNGAEFSNVIVNEPFEAGGAWSSGSSDVWFVGGPKKVFRFSP